MVTDQELPVAGGDGDGEPEGDKRAVLVLGNSPLAIELGVGVCPWGPLASGMLTGKYQRSGTQQPLGDGRLQVTKESGHPGVTKLFTERNWKIVDALISAAKELGRSPAQVALNWIAK